MNLKFWERHKRPKTLQEAVAYLKVEIARRNETKIFASFKKEYLIMLHFTAGRWLRNSLKLWEDSNPLLAFSPTRCPDETSKTILEAAWDELQDVEKLTLDEILKLFPRESEEERRMSFAPQPEWFQGVKDV